MGDKVLMNNKKVLLQSFICTFILGFIAHGYCFLNTVMSHDALNNIYIGSKWTRLRAGRFFYPLYLSWIRGRILVPWLIGILAISWIAIAVYMIVKLFEIDRTSIIIAVAGICVANPTVYSIAATYLHDLDADMFALMCAVLGAYLWSKAIAAMNIKHRVLFLGMGALAASVALGIYQSFLSATIVLIMLVCIRDAITGDDFIDVLKRGMQGIVMLAAAAVMYVIESVLFSSFTGISILGNSDYNSLGNVANSLSSGIFGSIVATYLDFIKTFKTLLTMDGTHLFLLAHIVIVVVIAALSGYSVIKMRWNNRVLFVLLGILMPFAMNVTYVLSGGVIHDLMRYAFWFVYLVALILSIHFMKTACVSLKIRQGLYFAVLISAFVIIFGNVQNANSIYMKKHLEYQGTLSYMTRVADRIESHTDYIPGETPVLFVGEDVIGKSRYGFEKYERFTGVNITSPLTFYDTYDQYFEYVLGLPLNFSEDYELRQDERVQKMPTFPKEGSVTMIEGTMVVKLGE